VFDADLMTLLSQELLRERAATLIAETCAWSVGMSDLPHVLRRRGRLVFTGTSIGLRAATGQSLSGDEDGRIELGDGRPGSFQDALNALAPDGTVHAERYDEEVLVPFVRETCVLAADRMRRTRPAAWRELLDELGEEDTDDLAGVVRAGEWDVPLRATAEHLVLAALGAVPLVEVEAEGLPLSLVRAAEAVTRDVVAPRPAPPAPDEGALAGALFLATAALRGAALPVPVPPDEAAPLLTALLGEGLEPEEVALVLPHLPVEEATVGTVTALLAAAGSEG
jgi:hypothetical protein